jgi:O-antigen/teichoic acid export membrane protein
VTETLGRSHGSTGTAAVTATAARQGAVGLVGAVCAGLGGLALTVTVGRVLDREHAGVYFTVVALFTIASTVLALGADTGLMRGLSAMREHGAVGAQRQLVRIALRPVLVAGIVTVVVVELVAGRVAAATVSDDLAPQLATAVRLVAPALVLAALTQVLLGGAARGLGSLRTYTVIQQIFLPAGRPLLVLAAVLAVGENRDGALVALAAWVLPLLVAVVLAAYETHRRLPARELAGGPPFGWPPSEPWDAATEPVPDGQQRGLALSFWRATAPRAVAATFEILIVWSDVVLVTALIGPRMGAVYAAASRFVTSGTFALQAVRLSVAPMLAAAFARGDASAAAAVHRLSVRWALLSTWPVYLALAAFAPGVLTVLGHGYTQAATALSILSLAMLGVVATGNANTVLNMAHRSHWAAGNTGFATVVMLAIDLALVPRLGIVGAALGWSAAMLTDACLGVFEVRHGLGLSSFDRSTRRAAVAALAGFGLPALLVRLTDVLVLRGSVAAGFVLLVGTALAGTCYLLVLVRHRRELELDDLVAALRRRPAAVRADLDNRADPTSTPAPDDAPTAVPTPRRHP